MNDTDTMSGMTRREALRRAALGAAAVGVGVGVASEARGAAAGGDAFALPALPYAADALEPHIDARTMEIHHGKHHAAYVANLNKAVAGHPELAGKSIEELVRHLDRVPEGIRMAVRNNGGGHLNHTLFWKWMKKGGGGEPRGELRRALEAGFGSLSGFKEVFTKAALGQFGSGWAWLVREGKGLKVEASANQDNPWSQGRVPILGVDVWEHAYYLRYQNRRADYVAAFFNVVDWDQVAALYAA